MHTRQPGTRNTRMLAIRHGLLVFALVLLSGRAEPAPPASGPQNSLPPPPPPAATAAAVTVESAVAAAPTNRGRVLNGTSRSVTRSGVAPAGMRNAWLWRYLLSMLTVGALLYLCLKGLKWCRGRVTGQATPSLLVRQRLTLDSKTALVLLSARDVDLLIAHSPAGVQVLERWRPPPSARPPSHAVTASGEACACEPQS